MPLAGPAGRVSPSAWICGEGARASRVGAGVFRVGSGPDAGAGSSPVLAVGGQASLAEGAGCLQGHGGLSWDTRAPSGAWAITCTVSACWIRSYLWCR